MNRKLATLYGALLASAIIAAPAYAQNSGTSGSGGNDANGSTSTMMPKPKGSSAQEAAPSQQPKAGASTAAQAAPGQQKCAPDQKNCDQGKMGQQKTGQATTTEQPKQQTGQATSTDQTKTSSTTTTMKPKQQTGQATTTEQQKTGQATTTTQPKQQTGQATQQQTGTGSSSTTAAGTSNETTASINVTDQQRTEIKQVITETKVEPAQVDFDVNVGVAVPKKVHLHKLPARIVKLVPAYQGYEYFVLADGRIVIVEPDTMKIVYILT